MTRTQATPLASSFRDPAGFLYTKDDILYRQINMSYKDEFTRLEQSGLLELLISQGMLINHTYETQQEPSIKEGVYKLIRPQVVPFISYPYEWCFSQLRDAALLTLRIALISLEHGMILKDASAYNIQFLGPKPIFIDTLSFEIYREGAPWIAYNQFCKHFLNPLILMTKVDHRLGQLSKVFVDGVETNLTKKLLPIKNFLRPGIFAHVLLNNKIKTETQKLHANQKESSRLDKSGLVRILTNLQELIESLEVPNLDTTWRNYYQHTNYLEGSLNSKMNFVKKALEIVKPETVWGLGANTGLFSKLCAESGSYTCAFDVDFMAVEQNYLNCKKINAPRILPLLMDLTNPSSQVGWANEERLSLSTRGPRDLSLSLALIHHLAIGNNVPLEKLADYLSRISKYAIVEFVPKEDSNAQKLLSTRADIFVDYNSQSFEEAFADHFELLLKEPVLDSMRLLYLLKKLP